MNTILIIILISILMILAWAIFSNRTEAVIENKPAPEKEQAEEPEKILRRRSSDRAIEKEFPAEKIASESSSEAAYDRDDSQRQVQLPFPANDIITDGSRFKLYKRALINSEIYAKRGDIETAVSLFKGVKDRILDNDIRSKIESNINYLNHFRHRREEDFKKRVESANAGSGATSGELRLKIDGPVPQTINIGLPDKSAINTEEIVEKLSEQISKELGTLKGDIEKLKARPEDRSGPDGHAEFSNLQQEFNTLRVRFDELTEDRVNTLKELNKLREKQEKEPVRESEKEHSPENSILLKEIRREIEHLSGLKHSLDSLHNKIEDISALKIPESKNQPSIIQAKYDSPIPVHFDPKPVLELLDRINLQKKEEKEHPPEKAVIEAETEEALKPEDLTGHEAAGEEHDISDRETARTETVKVIAGDVLFPLHETAGTEPVHDTGRDEVSLDDLTTLEAEEFINESHPGHAEDLTGQETLFEEPEHRHHETHADRHEQAKEEDIPDELSGEEISRFTEEKPREKAGEFTEPSLEDIIRKDLMPGETLKARKEKEIEKHTDAEEDPNDFDLLSDIGKVKDDSTLSDEDIFEKILRDEKNKRDDSAFEIIGDVHKDDQEFALNDSILDGKKKAEQDFYRKFIKADRIKKRELPILKVSYDFKKLPDEFSLSREKNILEYSFYKYKPMLEKADDYIRHRRVRDAINYYKVVLDQNIPVEFKAMIKRNIRDLTEYLEKYLTAE